MITGAHVVILVLTAVLIALVFQKVGHMYLIWITRSKFIQTCHWRILGMRVAILWLLLHIIYSDSSIFAALH